MILEQTIQERKPRSVLTGSEAFGAGRGIEVVSQHPARSNRVLHIAACKARAVVFRARWISRLFFFAVLAQPAWELRRV